MPHTLSLDRPWPLHNSAQTQAIERHAQTSLPAYTLMRRAGLATAQLAQALAPHARTMWIACGPGNNGGDGLEAATQLTQRGKQVVVTWLGRPAEVPHDAQQAWERAHAAGVSIGTTPPASFDLAIDAMLGVGGTRTPEGAMAQWLHHMHTGTAPILSVDLPTGLLADTGQWLCKPTSHNTSAPRHTLSLLTLKPGLFTADGRDAAGTVWFDDLGVLDDTPPCARLHVGQPKPMQRWLNSHKGSYGDVIVVGGAEGMAGAAVLASVAALHAGAGRVYLGLLDASASHAAMAQQPALMVRDINNLSYPHAAVVCGCGGADAVRAELPRILSTAHQLVLDADALNAIAQDSTLARLLQQRATRQRATVLTPHPLEAARLLGCSSTEVQRDRLHAAQALADQTQSVVVLKGSGSVIAQTGCTPIINRTGNAKLATAGTGDVLAGWIGALLAQGTGAFDAACTAVCWHGAAADAWPDTTTFDAAQLAASVRA